LSRRMLLDSDGITVEDFACRHTGGRGDAVELRRRVAPLS
jgi:hypothetical protein